jgi:hypothetical protein
MHERKLDPRQGRWWATERLVRPPKTLPRQNVIQKWADLLLKRWGIVSKDIVTTEVAAPPWAELMREFKRRELLGQINRGYFIEGHPGVQYGLPEAIELLRDCRARRSDGQALGYLPDESVFAITNKDPANLYFSCLDILDERGEIFRTRQGNFISSQVIQAGQVLGAIASSHWHKCCVKSARVKWRVFASLEDGHFAWSTYDGTDSFSCNSYTLF